MPDLTPLHEGSKTLAAKVEDAASLGLSVVASVAQTLAALAERVYSFVQSGGTWPADPDLSGLLYPGALVFPDPTLYPGGSGPASAGMYPSLAASFPSSRVIVEVDAPRMDSESEGTLTLTPLLEN